MKIKTRKKLKTPTAVKRRTRTSRLRSSELVGQMAAIQKTQAVVEFSLDGTVLAANSKFLELFGYSELEIIGKPHVFLVEAAVRESSEYRLFWERLGRGMSEAGRFKRIGKYGKEVWIQASYNPILDSKGLPYKVVKFATDITAQVIKEGEINSLVSAITKSQAIISFNLDGTIVDANDNFLSVFGYGIDEVRGKHHSLFVTPAHRDSMEYKLFWEKLRRGEFDAGIYQRIGKGGRTVWIQASYYPLLDANGRAYKIAKFASDITAQISMQEVLDLAVNETQSVVQSAVEGDLTRRLSSDGAIDSNPASVDGYQHLAGHHDDYRQEHANRRPRSVDGR